MGKVKNVKEISFNSIEGIRIGNAQNFDGQTGCTVLICEKGAPAGVDVRGGSPGTRETDLLNPVNLVDRIHAVMLSGGSAFGLDAASGAMQYLEERNIGFDVGVTKVPIVCSAVLFDLKIGNYKIRPDKKMGYEACKDAELNIVKNGNVGAGTGATVGKISGIEHSMKGGLGVFAMQEGELKVGAVVAVNCLGDVVDPKNKNIIAGVLGDDGKHFLNSEKIMLERYRDRKNLFSGNTTIGVVVTNAKFTKTEMNKIAQMTHDGYARTMNPAHSMFDGDTIFSMSTGDIEADMSVVGFLSANVMEKAILRAVQSADSVFGFKSYKDISK